MRTSSSADPRIIAFRTPLFHIDFLSSYLTVPPFRRGSCHVKTARFVLSCHSVGTSLPEIVLSAWMSASSFAGSPRCALTWTRNVAAPAVVLFRSSSIASSKISASGAPTNVTFPPSPTHLLTAFSRAWLSHKYSMVLSQGCRVMPRERPLVPDGSSWILPLRVPPSSAAFSFVSAGSHILLPFSPLFG